MSLSFKRKAGADESSVALKKKIIARERWHILAQTLNGHQTSETQQSAASVRRFRTFGLLKTKRRDDIPESDNEEALWYTYTSQFSTGMPMSITIRHLSEVIKPSDLLGFNNTGNVCVWPSEEVMTYYCIQHLDDFRCANVIELGGGMTCLAGVAVAVWSEASHVLLTDGNEQSVENLKHIINHNVMGETNVSVRLLRWGPDPLQADLQETFDIVLCGDCLFFDEGREHLLSTINSLLKPKGQAWVFAPSRNGTFEKFCNLAKALFHLEKHDMYDDAVWSLHSQMTKTSNTYSENLHYPLFVRLTKPPCKGQDSRDTTPESR